MESHGDEAIAANCLAGFEGIPSFRQAQQDLFDRFSETLVRLSPDFQTEKGYEIPAPGRANLSMSTAQLAERFGAVSMTLEMPFKDNDDLPDPDHGWSPERSRALRPEEHTSELQSLMRISYAVFCLKKKNKKNTTKHSN